MYGRVSQGAKTGYACVEFGDFHYRGVTVLQGVSYPLQRLLEGEVVKKKTKSCSLKFEAHPL